MSELKLYVWDEFSPDYTDGLAVALATNECWARHTIRESLKAKGFSCEPVWGPVTVRQLDECFAAAVHGGS